MQTRVTGKYERRSICEFCVAAARSSHYASSHFTHDDDDERFCLRGAPSRAHSITYIFMQSPCICIHYIHLSSCITLLSASIHTCTRPSTCGGAESYVHKCSVSCLHACTDSFLIHLLLRPKQTRVATYPAFVWPFS